MTTDHPITPPPELVRHWNKEAVTAPMADQRYIAIQAANWGADQELEACCKLLELSDPNAREFLRAARRPQAPPSLKEQALEALQSMQIDPVVINGINVNADVMAKYDILRRALEQLDD